jgi:hypothetical protein
MNRWTMAKDTPNDDTHSNMTAKVAMTKRLHNVASRSCSFDGQQFSGSKLPNTEVNSFWSLKSRNTSDALGSSFSSKNDSTSSTDFGLDMDAAETTFWGTIDRSEGRPELRPWSHYVQRT